MNFNFLKKDKKLTDRATKDTTPVSTTEKLVREEIQKLKDSSEEIKKWKEHIEKENNSNTS